MQKRVEHSEAGFAMLFVFLLAGFVAISLYMELPRVVFEAQRTREQMLIDRGEQYQRAIQLYFRRFRVYPPNMEALESTNNIRFLRQRYKDPMTGEDEWRLIRGLPNGIFLDSLVVKPPGQQAKEGETAVASAAETGQPLWQQRRPSDATLPPNPGQETADTSGADMPPPMPGFPAEPVAGEQVEQAVSPGQQPAYPPGLAGVPVIGGAPGIPVVPGMPPTPFGQQPGLPPGVGQNQAQFQAQVVPGVPTVPGQPPGQPTGAANPALEIIRQMLTTPNPRGLAAIQMATGNQQTTGVAGIAGVASKLEAEGIMVYNDRTKYNEWEFLYDPRLDLAAAALLQQGGPQQPQAPGQQGLGGFGGGPGGQRPGRGMGGVGGEGGGMGPGGRGGMGGPGGRGGITPFPFPGGGFGGGRGGTQPQQPNR